MLTAPRITTQNNSTTKITSRQLSEITRICRKQQGLKKKLKQVTDANTILEKQIKKHEQQIKQQRNSIQYLLVDLNKQLKNKFSLFQQRHMQKQKFKDSQTAHITIQQMMQDYQKIQKESLLLKRVFNTLSQINQNYTEHAKQTEDLVINLETANKQYQQSMHETMTLIKKQFDIKTKENNDLELLTEKLQRQIEEFQKKATDIRARQKDQVEQVEKARKQLKQAEKQLQSVDQWSQMVIDNLSRKNLLQRLAHKQQILSKKRKKNEHLQILFKQLDIQHNQLIEKQNEKQNIVKIKKNKKQKKK